MPKKAASQLLIFQPLTNALSDEKSTNCHIRQQFKTPRRKIPFINRFRKIVDFPCWGGS
jgi:hypothetical protein